MTTAWGYEVNDTIEPLLSVEDFNAMTGGAYASNPRVESALKAASQVIRNYCGWHICPVMDCTAEPFGTGRTRRLPAGHVVAVDSVTEDSHELESTDYEWRKDGLIRKTYPQEWPNGWGAVEVAYSAGYEIDAVPDLAEAVAAITSGVLAVSAGVISESADGVSISYSANASSIAAALTSQQKDALEPYKVVSSHAA